MHEPGGLQRRIVVAGEHRGERLPSVGRVADAESGGDRARQAALLEVGDGAGRLLELGAIELRRLERNRRQIHRLLAPVRLARAFDARHLEPGVPRELFDGIGKRLAAVLHQEADGRAVRAAAEAVVELLRRAHRERRRLLAVERAARLVVRPGLLERDVAVDDVDDVDP